MAISDEARWQENDLVMAEAYADDHPDWDDSFIRSLRKYFSERKLLTEKQHAALMKVIESWHIAEWYEENYG